MSRPRAALGLSILAILVLGVAMLRLLIYRDLEGVLTFRWASSDIMVMRWTAIASAAIVGAALAVSGVLLQTLLRNPLASPFILGVSSGAALGVIAAMYLRHALNLPIAAFAGDGPPALIGAVTILAIVFLLGRRRGQLDPLSILLIGVVVSAICGAFIMFLQHLVPQGLKADLVTWMMGVIRQGVPGATLLAAGAIVLLSIIWTAFLGRAMDAATLSDDEARSVGVSLSRLRIIMFLLAGLLAAIAVTLAGPIGFVGLIAPHAARLILGPRHSILILGAALTGIFLLVSADVGSQAIHVTGGRMPIGVFTAVLGGPAFIWLLRTGRGRPA